MRTNPLILFILIVGGAIFSTIAFIQSEWFASRAQGIVSRTIPGNFGMEGGFSHFQVQFFPPGVAIARPLVSVTGVNPAKLPVGTLVAAEQLLLRFRPMQVLSGRVSIHEVRVVNGRVETSIEESKEKLKNTPPPSRLRISWEQLFQVRAEQITLENTEVVLDLPARKSKISFLAKEGALSQVADKNHSFYTLALELLNLRTDLKVNFPLPLDLESLSLKVRLEKDGLYLERFNLRRGATELDLNGRLEGEILSGTGLKLDAKMKGTSNLETLVKRNENDDELSGTVAFEGTVNADLDQWEKTLRARGALRTEDFQYGDIEIDSGKIEGDYNARTKDIHVEHALLSTTPREKKGPDQSGKGGDIEIGSFSTKLGSSAPVSIPVKLRSAHVNWLSSPVLDVLYSLDGRLTGDANLKVEFPSDERPFRLDGDVDLTMDALTLDNQKYGVPRKLTKIFVIPDLHLKGKVAVTPDKVLFPQMSVFIRESALEAKGEIRIGKKPGFDIRGEGDIDFKEVSEFIGQKASGRGELSVHVHGPAENVVMDFDSDLAGFEFIHLSFGDFKGRISYLDAEDKVEFRDLKCLKGGTAYTVGGNIVFGKKDEMNLRAEVPAGDVGDFLSIFKQITASYWWFPESLGGSMRGTVRVTGGLALDEMRIDSAVRGEGWDFYSERFREVDLRFNYDKGRYALPLVRAIKRRGTVDASLSFSEQDGLNWELDTRDFTLAEFDHVSQLSVPVRGQVSIKSVGHGKYPFIESETEASSSDVFLKSRALGDSRLVVQTRDGKSKFEGNLFGEQGVATMNYDLRDGQPSNVSIAARALDFSPILFILNSELSKDADVMASVTGEYQLSFLSGKSELGSGRARVDDYRLKKEGVRFRLDKPIELAIDRGSFQVDDATLIGDDGKIRASIRSSLGQLNGRIYGDLDLGVAEFVTAAIEKSEGRMAIDLDIGGGIKAPTLRGNGTLKHGMVRIRNLETPLEEISGRFLLRDGILELLDVDANLASGTIAAGGTIEFFQSRFPEMKLTIDLTNNKLKVYPFQYAKVRGKLAVTGSDLPYLVAGKVTVDQAISREKIANSKSPGFKTAQYSPSEMSSTGFDRPLFKLQIDVAAPGNIVVQNELVDLEAKGELRIVGTLGAPRPLGRAQAIQGKVLFKDRVFQIQSGNMEFDSPTSINPRFEVVANTEVSNRKIQMFASGRFDQYRIEFTSNPPMSDNEILTLLALGVSSDDAKRLRTTDRSAYEQGEAASLVLHSLDFNREVQNKTGIQIGVDQAVDSTIGQSIFRPRVTEQDNATAPKIVIRRDFGKRFGVSAGSTVGVGTSIQREVNAEMRVTPGFSVLGVWDSYEGATSDEVRRNSYGFDLKVQKRFK